MVKDLLDQERAQNDQINEDLEEALKLCSTERKKRLELETQLNLATILKNPPGTPMPTMLGANNNTPINVKVNVSSETVTPKMSESESGPGQSPVPGIDDTWISVSSPDDTDASQSNTTDTNNNNNNNNINNNAGGNNNKATPTSVRTADVARMRQTRFFYPLLLRGIFI